MTRIKKNQAYNIISPDGFTISRDEQYPNKKAARKAFTEWLKRYEQQGFYSSAKHGKIHVLDIEDYCKLIIEDKNELIED